jgi:hypothetical protein
MLKKCKTRTRCVSRLSELFLSTNIFCLSARNSEKRIAKSLGSVQPKLCSVWLTGLSGGAPDSVRCARLNSGEQAALGRSLAAYDYNSSDCLVVHWTVSDAPGWIPVNRPLSGEVWRHTAIIHRTVRWCTGLSGEPTVDYANGQQRDQRATRGLSQRIVGAPDRPVSQVNRCSNGQLSPIWKQIAHRTCYRTCPVVHRTVRCATRQKANIAFQNEFQRLLGPLGV